MKKEQDWTGNKKTTFATLGASNHTDHERADHDYYATEPLAADLICSVEKFEGGIWENCCVDCDNLDMMKSADGYVYCFSVDTGMLILRRNNFIFITGNCGQGHLSKRFKELGYNVVDTDLIDRGYGVGGVDFFECDKALAPNIVTNPPYKYAKEWVEHSLELLDEGNKLALFLPIQFLESDSRRGLFATTPPETVYVCVNRILCGMNGNFNAKDKDGNTIYNKDGSPKKMSSAKCYAWFVWRKGYVGDTTIKWIN